MTTVILSTVCALFALLIWACVVAADRADQRRRELEDQELDKPTPPPTDNSKTHNLARWMSQQRTLK